jgi:thiamine-phosphate pyrophosphorylase
VSAIRAERVARFARRGVYPVTTEALSAGRSDDEVVEGLIAGGATLIQLRDKRATKREVYAKARRIREVTAAAGVLLLINDHLDVALAVDADGVHLGQDDLPVPVARRLAPDLLIGASTHNAAEAERAEREGADVINIGPIFPTATKSTAEYAPLGPDRLSEIAARVSVPFSVMGGIKLHHVADLVARGASRIAVVTALTQADDIAAATRAFTDAVEAAAAAGG